MVEELNNSILAQIGSAIAWIFAPLGWTKAGEGWKMAVAAVTGLIAKENVVATQDFLQHVFYSELLVSSSFPVKMQKRSTQSVQQLFCMLRTV